jgi:predicted ATPase/class 3 adenylate cyclase
MRRDLPSGTVTFLFTDVEGSTELLHELGAEAYAEKLAKHRKIVREACAARGGVEVDTQGDAFFLAFPTAPAAIEAARAITEELASGPIALRIGLHTGTPLLTEDGYVGDDVHFAARVAASAHGGQVVLSPATRTLLDERYPLLELGEHRLKDIPEPVAIFQLGAGQFPPLKTISNTNLPRPASSFVGRERELQEVISCIEDGSRLLTLTAPGGSGKTRLALEAAATLVPEYKAGVFWVGLASLRDPALVTETIAQTLGAKDGLADHIGEREMLLLLDNLEQVIEAAPELSSLLQGCRNLTLLVTSRELLRVQGEVEYPVPPLVEAEALSLFCERAQAEPSDEINELCRRLDNLPLAVELAAARAKALSPAQILERLSQRLDLLKGGRDADPRQQTLRATIEWSYDLLSEDEQQLFARLSVFAGGCTLEAAEEVTEAELDTLQSLVEKSLVRFSSGRYWMLETIREYALERIGERNEVDDVGWKHATRHARLAVELFPSLREHSSRTAAILEKERENMRAALEFALQRDDPALAGDLMHGLWFYWLIVGSGGEAAAWARRYLASSRERLSPLERMDGDLAAAEILRFTGDLQTAATLKQEFVEIGRSNPDALVRGEPILPLTAANLSDLSYMELVAGRVAEARSYAEEALGLRRALGRPSGIAHALFALADVAYNERDFERARGLFADAHASFKTAGAIGDALTAGLEIAECELLLGRPEETAALLREVIPRLAEVPDRFAYILALRAGAMLAATNGDAERCAELFGAADRRLEESEMTFFTPVEDEIHRAYLKRARSALSADAFDRAYERGAQASDETAFELALSTD